MLNSQTQSQSAMSILGYVPALVVQHLLNIKTNQLPRQLPEKQTIKSVVMFADISGFTKLTEKLSQLGTEGAERIAFAINRYMELLVQGIGRSGGDIFKFAGDAMIVLWPPPIEDERFQDNLETLLKQAIQSALFLQEKLTKTTIEQGIQLSVKIGTVFDFIFLVGFGVGELNIIHVGGIFARTEYLATGDPLIQAFSSEHCLTEGGKIIISSQVHGMIGNFFECRPVDNHPGFYQVISLQLNQAKVKMKADALLIKNNLTLSKFNLIKNEINSYIPAALLPYIEINEEAWSAELRRLTILFVNLSIDLSDAKTDKGLGHIQRVIQTVQKCIYMHEGSLNKLLMDDKGSTLIVVFGLPPLSHQNDSVRAILTAQLMRQELPKISCSCSIGIVTGTVFAGVVGTSGSRREYSVIGDSVNLAARLMQAACEESVQKILLCTETAKSSEHHISTVFFKKQTVKGKNEPVFIYVPLDKPLEPTAANLFPNFKTHAYSYGFQKQTDFKDIQLFGREEQYKQILNLIDRNMRGVDKKYFLVIKGPYGIGKSILVKKVLHRVQEKVIGNQYNPWKYGELPQIIISQLDPITRSYRLNGLRQILQQIFVLYSKRIEKPTDMALFQLMVDESKFNQETVILLQEILGLREMNKVQNFPQKPNDDEDFGDIKRIVFQFLSNYFEQIPTKYKDLYEGRSPEEIGWDIKGSVHRVTVKYSIKYSNIIAPIVIAMDDCQNYDFMSFKILQMMIKHYDRMFLIALYRDVFQELTFQPKNVEKKKSQEEIAMDGIALLEDAIDSNQYSIIHLRGIEKKNKDDELAKMIRFSFNIHKFVPEIELQSLNNDTSYLPQFDEIRGRGNTAIIDVQGQENYNKELNHQFLFYENKQKLLEKDVELLLLQYIYLKTGGNPLNVLNLMQCLIDQEYIKLGTKFATLTNEMINLINYEESIVLDVPCCRIEVNGPIIDKLTCLEQLILKVSSVIGDIFDIQTLNKINPFKVAVNNKLQKIMDDLEQKDLIEVMEVQEQNIYYRFTHPFMRDTLYQRITFKQRRQLHKGTAEAIQVLPIAFETEELVQSKKLQFNWLMAEQTNQIDQQIEKNHIIPQTTFIKSFLFKATFGLAGQRRQNHSQQAILEDQKYKQFENMSSKALRSIILKQISNKLTMNNNSQNTILKEGILEKKSKQNVTWAPRYFIIDGKEFRCYYNKQDVIKGEIPLCTIPLKGIYSVLALDERQYTEVKYPFQLSSTIWYKKNKELGDRKFFFNAKNAEELEMWTIYLEFAKAKAIYDDFTNNFGKISFPIGNQSDYYDSDFKYDINIDNKRMNLGSALDKNGNKSRGSMVARNSRVSKFTLATKQFKFMEKSQFEENTLQQSQVMDGQLLKDRVHCFLQKGMLLLFSHIFDMSLQKEEDYKIIGTSNLVMRKLNNIFKVEKSLLTDNKKGSSTFMMDKSSILSPSHDQLNSRKQLNQENFNIGIKKTDDSDIESDSFSSLKDVSNKQKTLELIKEEDEMVEEQSVKLSESTLLKQQYLKQQRLQNQKFSFGDDSFTKMQNHLRVPSPLNSAHKNDEKSKDSNTHKYSESRGSQESFEQNQPEQGKRRNTERQEYQQVKSVNYFPKAKANIGMNTQQNLIQKEEQDNLKIIVNEINNVEQQDVGVQVSQQVGQNNLQNFNKSISKSSIEQKSESSSKDEQQNNNQDLNILQLLERESPKQPTNIKIGNVSSKNLDEHGKRDTISQYFPRGSHISSSHFQSTQNPITQQFNAQSTQQSTQLHNQKPKLIVQYLSRQSNISQKTLPNTGGVYSSKQLNSPHKSSDNLAIYATAINTSKSLSGDLFTLRPGYRVIVNKVDKQKQLVQCTYQNMTGLFYLRDIAVLDEPQMETDIPVKSRTPSSFENKYKQLLNDRFNHTSRSPNYKHSLTKSKTPTRITNRKTLIL